MKKQKDIVIKSYDPNTINELRNVRDAVVYLWKHAICTWHSNVDEFAALIKANNITIVYFKDKDNYLNKKQWIVSDGHGNYWNGAIGEHPFGGKAWVFLPYKSCAKKYISKKAAEAVVETIREKGAFKYTSKYAVVEA